MNRSAWYAGLTYLYVLVLTALMLSVVGFLLGLPNRRALTQHVREELHRAARYATPVSLLLIAVDGLKQVTDTHGHHASDRVIRTIALSIADVLREPDFGARWGGDEFAIVAPNTGSHAAQTLADRLLARVRTQRDEHGRSPTVSIGIATFDPAHRQPPDVESLAHTADRALYEAKAKGRNRVEAA